MLLFLPFIHAETDTPLEFEQPEHFVSDDDDDITLRLNTLELVTGIQTNKTSHENRIIQNESDVLFLLNWYNDVIYAINELLEYDFDIMRDDLDKNIDLVAVNAIDIETYARISDTNVEMIGNNTNDIVAMKSITSYLNPTDICADGRDNDLDGLIDEYDGEFLPFTNFGNCSLFGLDDKLEGTDIHGSTFEGTDLGSVTFSNVTINDTNFRSAVNASPSFRDESNVHNCVFTDSPNSVSFYNSDGSGCDFSGSNISGTVSFNDMSISNNVNLSRITSGSIYISNSEADSLNISNSTMNSITIEDSITQNIIGDNITLDIGSITIRNSDIDNSDFSNLYTRSFGMSNVDVNTVNLENTITTYSFSIHSSIIDNMILTNGNFGEDDEITISDSNILNSDFSGSIFNNLYIYDTYFFNTNLIDTQFYNFESYRNVEFSNSNMVRSNFTNAEIDPVNFTGVDLTDSIFTNSKIIESSFIDSTLNGVDFTDTEFNNVDLTGVSAIESIFTNSEIRDVSFVDANLDDADFTNVEFNNVDFSGASINGTIFTGCIGHDFCIP